MTERDEGTCHVGHFYADSAPGDNLQVVKVSGCLSVIRDVMLSQTLVTALLIKQ